MNARTKCLGRFLFATWLAVTTGCTEGNKSVKTSSNSATATSQPAASAPVAAVQKGTPDPDQHAHRSGAHGGRMVSLGRDSYHVEAVFETGGVLRLYTLGKDESRVVDIERQSLSGFVKVAGETEARPFTLEPEPQAGDAEGRTSQFVGVLPQQLAGRQLEITVPNLVIAGERFRFSFQSHSVSQHEEMPPKRAADEEQQLYLTPGGLYTAEDIKANGSTTASVKFKGIVSNHDAKPSPGDKICPISMTKANPQFTWIVGGKAYEFCCPPCIDELVKVAKSSPEAIKDPSEYVKKT